MWSVKCHKIWTKCVQFSFGKTLQTDESNWISAEIFDLVVVLVEASGYKPRVIHLTCLVLARILKRELWVRTSGSIFPRGKKKWAKIFIILFRILYNQFFYKKHYWNCEIVSFSGIFCLKATARFMSDLINFLSQTYIWKKLSFRKEVGCSFLCNQF